MRWRGARRHRPKPREIRNRGFASSIDRRARASRGVWDFGGAPLGALYASLKRRSGVLETRRWIGAKNLASRPSARTAYPPARKKRPREKRSFSQKPPRTARIGLEVVLLAGEVLPSLKDTAQALLPPTDVDEEDQ